jgi:hypothetical protein
MEPTERQEAIKVLLLFLANEGTMARFEDFAGAHGMDWDHYEVVYEDEVAVINSDTAIGVHITLS